MPIPRLVALLVASAALIGCSDSTRPGAVASPASSASSASSSSDTTSTPIDCARPHESGQSAETFDFEGQARTFQLYVPKAYDGTGPVPVVFNFHGYGSNAVQQMAYGNFKPLADRDDFLIVAPDGQGESRHFNLTGEGNLQDDVAMVGALLDHLESTFCVDAKRVYSTGMSDGGAMTSVLACRESDRFAAFGAVAVIVFRPGCGGSNPVAITGFMGTADPVVPFDGGQVRCCGGATVGSAPDAMAGWAEHDGCATAFNDERLGSEVRKRTWTGCQAGGEVVFYIIDGGGHTWPGSIAIDSLGLTTKQIDASATIWDFFKAHPRP
ncbi:MAG: polyhydroxybutyrate depolymerase [Acidimicrobiaceae bacterium]|jgi:polyhydroxybutyrate depolymerase